MPSNLAIGAFALGAVLLLASLLTGGFKIFGAEVSGTAGAGKKLFAFMAGFGFIVVGFTLDGRDGGTQQNRGPRMDVAATDARTATSPLNPEEELERQLRLVVEPLQKQLPVSVAPGWTTDQIHVGPGPRVAFVYTLQNFAGATAGTTSRNWGARFIGVYCNDPELRPLLDLGVTIVLSLRGGIDKIPFELVQINRIDCLRA